MRWGTEEVHWHDIFNSVKVQDKNLKHKEDNSKNIWHDFNWNLSSIWEDKYRENDHTFACFFGDIKALYPHSGDKVDLELKNGSIIKLNGGSNDIGTNVQIYDYELGLIKINWSKINKVEFSQAPGGINSPFGSPLYVELSTYKKGKIAGYLKWDQDERTTEDILDGRSNYGDQKIPFKNIKSILKKDKGVIVTLWSGKELYLTGSNDVNSENRGIAIFKEGTGSIQLAWNEFKKVDFIKKEFAGPAYNDFAKPEAIKTEVLTYDDKLYSGLTIFDIDEKWEIELLDGDDDNIEYQIPFRYIQEIRPKNKLYSLIDLKCGDQLLLGEKQDVSQKNDGVLVFVKSSKEPIHINWSEIVYIKFK
jgi:hypothetical protein